MAVEKQKSIYNTLVLACIYLWHNQIEPALQIATEFMNSPQAYEKFGDGIIDFLILLMAKHQYGAVLEYFKSPGLQLADRFKPLYYALLHFIQDEDYRKMPPELTEPVNEVITKVKQWAVDYA